MKGACVHAYMWCFTLKVAPVGPWCWHTQYTLYIMTQCWHAIAERHALDTLVPNWQMGCFVSGKVTEQSWHLSSVACLWAQVLHDWIQDCEISDTLLCYESNGWTHYWMKIKGWDGLHSAGTHLQALEVYAYIYVGVLKNTILLTYTVARKYMWTLWKYLDFCINWSYNLIWSSSRLHQ
jgi:hypothetical protein